MIWQDIYTTLHNYSGVVNLVGTHIYPNIVDQDPTYPCISTSQISEYGIYNLAGPSDKVNPNWQIDAWAMTYSGVATLAAQIRSAMDSATLFNVVLINQLDVYEPDLSIHHIMMEFSIWAKA